MMLKLTIGLLVLTAAALPAEAQSRTRKKGKAEPWNQWRGPKRDNISPETGLLKKWPSGGPKLVWKATGLGEGYSSVSTDGKMIFTMGDVGSDCKVFAINAEDGKVAWSTVIGKSGTYQGYAGPRGTPATDGKLVYSISQHGDIVAVAAANGRIAWKNSMAAFGGRPPSWGYSESPLLDGRILLCTPGGGSTVVGLLASNGRTALKSKKVKGNVHYTSLGIAQLGRAKLYLVLTDSAVAGLAANGRVAFELNRRGRTAVIPTPVFGDGVLFVTSGYGVGYTGFAVGARGAKQIYSSDKMDCKTGGVVLIEGHVYGFGENSRGLKCINVKTGNVVWENDSVGGSMGSVSYADGHLIVRSESGTVGLVEATPTGYKEKGRFSEPDRSGKQTWPPPVIADGKLYLRDQDRLLCYDLKGE